MDEKTYTYRWTHAKSGCTGTRSWTGWSREDFLADLANWNRLGSLTGQIIWTYVECEND